MGPRGWYPAAPCARPLCPATRPRAELTVSVLYCGGSDAQLSGAERAAILSNPHPQPPPANALSSLAPPPKKNNRTGQTGMLWNTEGGSPMVPIGEQDLPTPILVSDGASAWGREHTYACGRAPHLRTPHLLHARQRPPALSHSNERPSPPLREPSFPDAAAQGSTAPPHVQHSPGDRARVFQGGYYLDLHKMLDVSSGSEVGRGMGRGTWGGKGACRRGATARGAAARGAAAALRSCLSAHRVAPRTPPADTAT